ncbi:MAG: hypothetical protein K6G82_00770 [Ruminococcus sp.]|nr:hypothetical protein [Ruminococcus sp.]
MAMMKIWNDPPGAHFRIRNGVTGAYIHLTLFRIMEFSTRNDAILYMNRRELNRNVYYVEVF